MKVLITGSSGFIGAALVSKLRSGGHTVFALDVREPSDRSPHEDDYRVDITNLPALVDTVRRLRPDQIVHLAARTDISADSVVKYHANIEGVANLVQAVLSTASVSRVLWTSTQLVSRVGRIPAHDTDFDPDTSYGESKVIGERIVRSTDGGGREWAILRPTTVWGPGMSAHYVSLLRYLERRRYFHPGGVPTPKSFSYIGNAVSQIAALLSAPARSVHRSTFYIADYEPIDMRGWCDALARELGVRTAPVVPTAIAHLLARTGDVLNATVAPGFKFNSFRLRNISTPYVFDNRNLREVTGPLPFSNASAIRATVSWYRNLAAPATRKEA